MTETRGPSDSGILTIGVDLGGTKILAAVVDGEGVVRAAVKTGTRAEQGPDKVIKRIIKATRQAVDRAGVAWEQIVGLGVGAPGPIDPESGTVFQPPNLPGWDEVPLGPRLSEALGLPVRMENDVNLGAWGEFVLGAGRGTRDMIAIFVGTGVGGGVILDGKLRSGFRHAAGEVGHMVLLADGPVCGCGKRGCLEALASRTAIERDIRLGIAAGRESLMTKLTAGGSKALTSGTLAKALRRGDPLVTEVVARAQWYLGLHAASIVNLLDPEMIVYGGGVVEALGDEFLAPIRTIARQYYLQSLGAERIQLVVGALGDRAGVLGAALLARPEGL